jgi:Glycosyltransferase family 87
MSLGARVSRLLGVTGRGSLLLMVIGSSLFFAWLSMTQAPNVLYDFKGGLYDGGSAVVRGHDPYAATFLAHQAAIMRAGGTAIGENAARPFSLPIYPAPANLAAVPFSLLPFWLAGLAYTLMSVGAMLLALRWLGVRDWRCSALALVSWPVVFSLWLGAMGPLLLLGAAAAWRWRERLWPPAIALAAIIVAKLFPWPLAVWLLITRRWRTFALTVGLGIVLMLGAWAVLGFTSLAAYPKMLSDATYIQQGRASSLVAVLLALGAGASAAHAIAMLTGGALLLVAWRVAQRDGGERQAFGLTVLAALSASPIVWDHYMVLLFVPIALSSPRFSAIWFLPTCTPLPLVIMTAISAPRYRGGAIDPSTTRDAVLWMAIELVIGVWLLRGACRPATQRWTGSSMRRQLSAASPIDAAVTHTSSALDAARPESGPNRGLIASSTGKCQR